MGALTDAEALARLLWIIGRGHADHYIEVRSLGKPIKQTFVPCNRPERLASVIRKDARTHDVYVGAAPRTSKHGGRDAIAYANVLWADCDTKASVAKLAKFTPRPSMVIFSGSGYNAHAWWALDSPVKSDVAEELNRRIAHALDSDMKVTDPPRILRAPGTLNHKWSPPRRVRAVEARDTLHSTQPFADLPNAPSRANGGGATALRGPRTGDRSDSLLSLSAEDYVGRLLGRHVQAGLKTTCPFHDDWGGDGGSLHIYPGDRGWHCFGCGKGGSVYDFGHYLWNLPTRGPGFVELRERLERELGVSQ